MATSAWDAWCVAMTPEDRARQSEYWRTELTRVGLRFARHRRDSGEPRSLPSSACLPDLTPIHDHRSYPAAPSPDDPAHHSAIHSPERSTMSQSPERSTMSKSPERSTMSQLPKRGMQSAARN